AQISAPRLLPLSVPSVRSVVAPPPARTAARRESGSCSERVPGSVDGGWRAAGTAHGPHRRTARRARRVRREGGAGDPRPARGQPGGLRAAAGRLCRPRSLLGILAARPLADRPAPAGRVQPRTRPLAGVGQPTQGWPRGKESIDADAPVAAAPDDVRAIQTGRLRLDRVELLPARPRAEGRAAS